MTRRKQKPRKVQAVLTEEDLAKIRAAAAKHSALANALIEWLYTHGARASEPGLARMSDVDLYNGTVMLTHLKGGLEAKPVPLAKRTKEALEAWFAARVVPNLAQKPYVFPSANPMRCYPCRGQGEILRRARRKDKAPEIVSCPHCHGTGTRWGMTRHEVDRLVIAVFKLAGIPEDFQFPHILRHSAVTHMLDGGVVPTAIQERVGHKALTTTFSYMHATKKAREDVTRVFDGDDEDDEDEK